MSEPGCSSSRLRRVAGHVVPSPAAATSAWESVLAEFPDGVAPQPPAGWTDGFMISNGARLHYWRTHGGNRPDGTPKPQLLLSHGFGDNGLSWWYLFADLTDQFELISVEARGHGLSDPPTAATPSDAQCDDIAGAIAALGLVKPIVMGHSMGAASAMWFAARYPDLPRAVVLEDPGMRLASAAAPPAAVPSAEETAAAWAEAQLAALTEDTFMKNNMSVSELLENSRENVAGSWGVEQPPVEEMVERWAQNGYQMLAKQQHHPNAGIWNRLRGGGAQPAASELFDATTAPTLILKQDDQERENNIAIAAHLTHPLSELMHVKGAGHNVRRDQKERMLSVLLPFLGAV